MARTHAGSRCTRSAFSGHGFREVGERISCGGDTSGGARAIASSGFPPRAACAVAEPSEGHTGRPSGRRSRGGAAEGGRGAAPRGEWSVGRGAAVACTKRDGSLAGPTEWDVGAGQAGAPGSGPPGEGFVGAAPLASPRRGAVGGPPRSAGVPMVPVPPWATGAEGPVGECPPRSSALASGH